MAYGAVFVLNRFLLKSHTVSCNCTKEKGIFEVAWVRSKAKLTLNSQTHGLRYGMVQKKKTFMELI